MSRGKGPQVTRFVLIMAILGALLAAVWISSSTSDRVPAPPPVEDLAPQSLTVQVLETMPHDPKAYTQGLVWYEGLLYESTGQYGQSTLRRVDPATGEVLSSRELSPEFFGEGLARIENRLIQLTWREGTAFVWDREQFTEHERHRYEGEGWGLCFDGRHLVMSDGSSVLTFRDPDTFQIVREVEILLRDGAVGRLNELECAQGWIYANVYTTDWIVQIDPQLGRVRGLIDASGLLSSDESRTADVLNGIAFDEESQVFYLTGKLWPSLFAVRFIGGDED